MIISERVNAVHDTYLILSKNRVVVVYLENRCFANERSSVPIIAAAGTYYFNFGVRYICVRNIANNSSC